MRKQNARIKWAYPETFTVYPNFQIKIFTLKSSL